MKEKIILSIVAALLGLLVAGGAFYIYQMTRSIDEPEKPESVTIKKQPTPTPQNTNYLIVEKPSDEEVVNKRIVAVSGKTTPGSIIVVSSESGDQVIKPAENGNFSLTHTLGDGVNLLNITAIYQNGEEQTVKKTVTVTTEEF